MFPEHKKQFQMHSTRTVSLQQNVLYTVASPQCQYHRAVTSVQLPQCQYHSNTIVIPATQCCGCLSHGASITATISQICYIINRLQLHLVMWIQICIMGDILDPDPHGRCGSNPDPERKSHRNLF